MAVAGPFDRPIPGESLTGEPRNNPWENPPQMNTVEEAAAYYIKRLANEQVVDDFASLVQMGVPLKPIVQSVTQMGMLRGLHTVDVGMLVSPMIHAFLKAAMESLGLEVDDDGENKQRDAELVEMQKFVALATKYLEQEPEENDPGKELIEEVLESQEQEGQQEEKPQGLMAKG